MKHLRNKPLDKLSEGDAKSMLLQHGFYEYYLNDVGKGIEHAYHKQSNGKVIFDGSTSLYWQQSGSSKELYIEDVQVYIDQLNRDRFGGYDDWRLPTLDEAMSLMEPSRQNSDLHIDPIFDPAQDWIWTADKDAAGRVWVVDFGIGYCINFFVYDGYHVRAVRSKKD